MSPLSLSARTRHNTLEGIECSSSMNAFLGENVVILLPFGILINELNIKIKLLVNN